MPHFTVEYTANIAAEADVPGLLRKINETLIAQGGAFPIGGIRSRGIRLDDWCMADGADDYAFVHATFKIAAGREESVRKRACDALFDVMKAHFAELYTKRYLALSMEFHEFDEGGTWKHNNVHAKFRAAAAK